MPYLDMADPENFRHLIQLFLAAHPQYRALNAQVRTQAGDPSGHFLSQPMLRALAAWGRERHLLRRKDAARLHEVAEQAFKSPAAVVSLTTRVLGEPPRPQRTVLGRELYAWLYLVDADRQPAREEYVFTVAAARQILTNVTQDATESEPVRARAHELLTWLERQD